MTFGSNYNEFHKTPGVVLDVRTPSEYAKGHIPGAINLPLFSDAERIQVGTLYKQESQRAAILLGLELVGPKLKSFAEQAAHYVSDKTAKIYCWRGGMRSASMSWLLRTAKLRAITLSGGYKTFRRWTLDAFQIKYKFTIIGGMTGSGKTEILQELKKQNQQIIDLEALANHRGSTYGGLQMQKQPTTEHFENKLAAQLAELDPLKPIWIEDESRLIGKCHLPPALYTQMLAAPLFVIQRSLEDRLSNLLKEYSMIDQQDLIVATERLERRLGGQRVKEIVAAIQSNQLEKAIQLVLQYYDKTYQYGLSRKQQPIFCLQGSELSNNAWAKKLIQTLKDYGH